MEGNPHDSGVYKYIITQQDLDPDLIDEGIEVGDEIELDMMPDECIPEE